MATVAPGAGRSTARFERRLTTELPMVSAMRVAEVVEQAKALLESIDGAVRIATGFAIPMGMIVLAGSVVATRRRAAARYRPAATGRGNPRPGRAEPVGRVRLAVDRGRAGRLRRRGDRRAGRWSRSCSNSAFGPIWRALGLIPVGAILLAVIAGSRRGATRFERSSR